METKNKVCLINNIGPHYRYPIYHLIDEQIGCDFYFGDHVETPIKTLDYNRLKGFRKILHNAYFHHFYWQRGAVKLLFKPYKYYITAGEPYCLSLWVMLLIAKITGKRIIAWTHGWYGKETRGKSFIKSLFYKLHWRLLIYSDYAINLMKQQGISANKMLCIANSLDSDREKSLREHLKATDIYSSHFQHALPTIIYCGRVQRIKRIDMIVDAMCLLKQQGFATNLVVVGKDVDHTNLEDYCAHKGLKEHVWMYGPCYDDEKLGELFFNASVCVSPGNVGLTAIHSLSFGCPVITHDDFTHQMPEFEAVVPEKTGDFFKYGDTSDLASKIRYWASLNTKQRNYTQKAAFDEVDRKWNIHYQINIIKKALNE